MSLLPYAAQAVSRGHWVFPCNPAGTLCPESGKNIEKQSHLLRPGKPWKMRWGEAATNDLGQVVSWWRVSPEANIGVACKQSNLLIIDCDVAKQAGVLRDTPWGYLHDKLGPYVDGDDVLRELCQRYGGDGEYERLTDTYRVCTGSMGLHVYLSWPPEILASQASIAPGALDVRCNGGTQGGYVLAAGSVTLKGPYVAENDLPVRSVMEFPWLFELVREKPKAARVKSHFSSAAGGFNGLAEKVRYAPEGNRNNCLLWAARSMCEDGATQEQCEELLIPAGMEAGQSEKECRDTIRSAYRLQGGA